VRFDRYYTQEERERLTCLGGLRARLYPDKRGPAAFKHRTAGGAHGRTLSRATDWRRYAYLANYTTYLSYRNSPTVVCLPPWRRHAIRVSRWRWNIPSTPTPLRAFRHRRLFSSDHLAYLRRRRGTFDDSARRAGAAPAPASPGMTGARAVRWASRFGGQAAGDAGRVYRGCAAGADQPRKTACTGMFIKLEIPSTVSGCTLATHSRVPTRTLCLPHYTTRFVAWRTSWRRTCAAYTGSCISTHLYLLLKARLPVRIT